MTSQTEFTDDNGRKIFAQPVVIMGDQSATSVQTDGSKLVYQDPDGKKIYPTPLVVIEDLRSAASASAVVGALTSDPAAIAAVRGAATPVYDAEDQTLSIPGGPVVSLAAPAVILANLPVAQAGNAGVVYRVTDIGLPGVGVFLQSTGTGWRPLGGRALLAAGAGTVAAPLASLAAAGKLTLLAGGMVSGGSLVLPAGLLWTGAVVRCVAKLRHRGTGGAWTAAVRIGTLNTSSDNSFASASGAATNDQVEKIDSEAEFASATGYLADTFATANSPTTGAFVDRNSNINTAAVMYAGIYVGTVNAADFVDLVSYRFELIG